MANLFGWIAPENRTNEQHESHERAVAMMLPQVSFTNGTYREENGRFALWKLAQKANGGKPFPYSWQASGSCVGSGGSNMLRTLARVEIAAGDAEEYTSELWWPYTYGQSRRRAGMNDNGDGSLGSTWAEAIKEDGIFYVSEVEGLPTFKDADGWVQLTQSVEYDWANGSRKRDYAKYGLVHPVKSVVRVRAAREAKAGLANGYAMTIASNFGTRTIRPQGNPAVNIAEWDDTWPHQMYVDEAWDHPSLGLIFRIGNNWGPRAHPAPTQGEPAGGFYVTEKTFDRILSSNGTEAYLFSAYEGLKLRNLDFWYV